MNSVIIVAAGDGSRLGSDIPKQFINLDKNKSILNICVDAFMRNKLIDEIIIVVLEEWVEKIKKEFNQCKVVSGGKTRTESSIIGLNNCSKECINILIHDAARPFVSKKIILECIEKLKKYDAVIPILPATDSMICEDNNQLSYLDRSKVKIIQTPQAFKFKSFFSACKNIKDNTDNFSAFYNTNPNINYIFIKGDKLNFKITDKSDLKIAKKIYELRP